MRRRGRILVLGIFTAVFGCSTRPGADLLDWLRPAARRSADFPAGPPPDPLFGATVVPTPQSYPPPPRAGGVSPSKDTTPPGKVRLLTPQPLDEP